MSEDRGESWAGAGDTPEPRPRLGGLFDGGWPELIVQWGPVLVVLAGIAAYTAGLRGILFFDDYESVVNNQRIRSLWPFKWAVWDTDQSVIITGRPLTEWSFAVNYALHGTDPLGYHVVNLGLHLFSALALMSLLGRLLRSPAVGLGDRADGIALTVGLLWTVHPLNSEVVMYATQRTEGLMALFLLLTLYCADRIVASDDWVEWGDADGPAEADATRTEAPRGSRWWTLAAIACCAAGMASKQNMVIAPLLVALYDRAYRCRSWREWRRRAFSWNCRGPLYLGLLGCWLYLGLLLATSVNNPTAGMAAIRAGVMPWNYLLTQSQVIVHYLRLCVAPWPLLPTYDWPIVKDWTEAAVTGPAILALVLAGTLAWFLRPALGWAAVVFFFVLAPTSSVYPITTEVAAERRMYLPLAALLTLAAVGADRLLLRLTGGAAGTGAFLARAVPVASLAVAAAVATAVRTWDYRSELAIWTEAVRWYPDDFYINTHLGCALVNEGRYAEAAERLRKALGSRPEDGSSLVNLGISLERLGQDAEAERVLRHAVRVSPDEYRGHDSLGVVLERTGRPAEAADAFAEAVKLAPDNVRIRNRLAAISARLGRTDRAVEVLEETLKRSPDDRYALTCLAGLLAGPGPGPGADGRPRDAARAVELGEKAVAGEGETDPSAWSALATALAAGGKFPEAARAADRGRLAAESAQDAEKAARLSRSASLYRMGRADPDGFIPP